MKIPRSSKPAKIVNGSFFLGDAPDPTECHWRPVRSSSRTDSAFSAAAVKLAASLLLLNFKDGVHAFSRYELMPA